tara:strand:+ start:208 stop:552 length:345 start_codon:yes stop_codon:yes gene_type:complete
MTRSVFLLGAGFNVSNFFVVNFGMFISIKQLTDDVFEVTVADSATTTHEVAVTEQSLIDLTDNNVTKAQLIEFSFRFLLEKEPNTSILSSFDITVITKYFSDYKDEVRRWCDKS